MTGLEKSERVITAILSLLLEIGIRPSQLNVTKLDIKEDLHPYFSECFKWLEAEGIVRAAKSTHFSNGGLFVINPVLTAHGLNMLDKKIQYSDHSVTIAEAVGKASNDGKGLSQAGDFTGGFVAGLMKALGS